MPISPEGIPRALARAERYRFLNEPWQAESICRDVLIIQPDNQAAIILLVLSQTDQFEQGASAREIAQTLQIAETLKDDYQRAYYCGLVHERHAIAVFRAHPDYRSRRQVSTLFRTRWSRIVGRRRFSRRATMMRCFAGMPVFASWSAIGDCSKTLSRDVGEQFDFRACDQQAALHDSRVKAAARPAA